MMKRFLYGLASLAAIAAAVWSVELSGITVRHAAGALFAAGFAYLSWTILNSMPSRCDVAEEKRRKSGLHSATKSGPVTDEST